MKVAFFVEDSFDPLFIEILKKYFLNRNRFATFFISNQHAMDTPIKNIAVINRYYLRWCHRDGALVFLNIEDAKKHFQDYDCEKFAIISKNDLKDLTKELIENTTILIREKNNQIRKAKNAELRSNVGY